MVQSFLTKILKLLRKKKVNEFPVYIADRIRAIKWRFSCLYSYASGMAISFVK
jgi:hypothetical protein